MHSVTLHQAPWVVPVSGPVLRDTIVAVDGAHIIAAGPADELRSEYPDAHRMVHERCALIPALINAHIHLELSHIRVPEFRKKVNGFTDWIETLLAMREEHGAVGEKVEAEALQTLLSQHRQGVIALGDIGNTDMGTRLRSRFPGILFHFNECLGRSAKTRRAIIDRVAAAPPDMIFTAHAPYSTHPELIKALKDRARKHHHPFPIHVAEPPSEKELLCSGTGELHAFLRKRGFIDDAYQPPASIDNSGSVQYLHELGVLDKRTICVHCIHVTAEEVLILARTGTKVCLCPGSNRYLEVGRAPVKLFLENGLLPALGTDSLASNPELSLWREMKILGEDSPGTDPASIFAMATLGGAQALGIEDACGSLEPGKSAEFLAVSLPKDITDETMLYKYLVQEEHHQPIWVNEL